MVVVMLVDFLLDNGHNFLLVSTMAWVLVVRMRLFPHWLAFLVIISLHITAGVMHNVLV